MADTPLGADSVRANPIARRSLLGALAAAPIAASSIAMATNTGSPDGVPDMNMLASIRRNDRADAWEDPAVVSRRIDADFWQAYDRQKRIYSQWMRCYEVMENTPSRDKVSDRWCHRHHEAECKMLCAGISTLPALYAKIHAATSSEFDFSASPSDDGFSLADLILFDIERMMKSEYRVWALPHR